MSSLLEKKWGLIYPQTVVIYLMCVLELRMSVVVYAHLQFCLLRHDKYSPTGDHPCKFDVNLVKRYMNFLLSVDVMSFDKDYKQINNITHMNLNGDVSLVPQK